VATYDVSVDNAPPVVVPGLAMNATGFAPMTGHTFRVRARDVSGNLSAFSQPFSFNTLSQLTAVANVANASSAVLLSAAASTSPPKLTLWWTPVAGRAETAKTIFRKARTASSWTTVATNVTTTFWEDSNVNVGTMYEYSVEMGSARGTIAAGIELGVVDFRGKVLVLVDSTVEGALTASLAGALDDLRGDGWLPVKLSFPRNASVPSIRAAIVSAHAAEPSVVKAVWLVGHIPPAFSGTLAPDGHSARAFPVDGYYGDVNGTWTPSASINVTTLQGTRTMAPANDARFSPDTIPSPLELAVGRVDMLNLPLIAAGTETQLLTAYFTKLHAWKTASTTATRRAYLRNGLGSAGISTAGSWADLSAIVGATAVTADTSNTVRLSQLVNGESYLWTVGHYFGEGVTGTVGGVIGRTADLPTVAWGGVFNQSFGSYFGDWDSNDSYLRALLTSGRALAHVYAGANNWFFHPMAMGEPIGPSVAASVNNVSAGVYAPAGVGCCGGGNVHMALMGDPTLRQQYLPPPGPLTVSNSGGFFSFSWGASPQPGLAGYLVYELTSSGITRLTPAPVVRTSFTSSTPFSTNRTFMVRAVKLEVSQGGTYLNASLGWLQSN
jgi:hypothetical protein